jgi:hypothetical protein
MRSPDTATTATSSRHQSGASLVLTLSLIVLVTFAAVAFFSRSTSNSAIESIRAAQVCTAQLVASGEDRALSLLMTEIAGNSVAVTNAGAINYFPSSSASMIPVRALAQSAMLSDTNFANLVRQSIPTGDPAVSSHVTSSPSRDGRVVDAVRWGAPKLISSGFSSTNQLPCWLYVNRDGTLGNSPSTNAIGRFAYNAYDIGGLLDANVAGRPGNVDAAAMARLKGTAAGADLTLLPGVSQNDVNALIAFRNPQATNPALFADYAAGGAAIGFLDSLVTNASGTAVSTNNFFATRQDLIRYVQSQNSGFNASLHCLTHFTRELARPSLNANGLSVMTNRFDLSLLAIGNPGATVLADLCNAISNSIPALTNTSDTNAYMGPTNFFAPAAWRTNVSVKIAAIAANVAAQASTNEVTIATSQGLVVGKKARPEVVQLAIQTITRVTGFNNPWYRVNIDLFVAPVVWSPAGGSGTYYLKTSFSNNGGLLSIDPPNKLTNVPSSFSGNSNIPLANYLTPTVYPIQMTSIGAELQKNHAQNIYNSVGNIALGVSTNPAVGSSYSSFGTNMDIPAPLSGMILNPTVQNPVITPDDAGSTTTNQFTVNVLDPRTIRGAGISSTNGTNLPAWTSYPPYPNSVTDTNPVIMERPYASVGEMGYVFRDQPWRSLDFVSGAGSADKAMLDTFSAYPTPSSGMRAGVVNLNTRQPAVLAALLAGTPTAGSGSITLSVAATYASNMVAVTSARPLTNRAQLVDLVGSNVIAISTDLKKVSREAAVRALAEVGQTRTWNMLIDVVAQNGKFTGSSVTPGDFRVLGERRVWVSVAIDRVTGRIIDSQSEEVSE